MLNIEPIKLLSGSHSNTAQTGQGCFMNVIAYLNGEPQITDQSPCVCMTIRPIAIYLNDFANDEQRQRLLPYVLRAMGTATDDKAVIEKRIVALVKFAEFSARLAESEAQHAAKSAKSAKSAEYAKSADLAADLAAECAKYADLAAKSAKYAAEYAEIEAHHQAVREEIFAAGLEFLDVACNPAQEYDQCIIQRANELIALN